VVAGIFPTSPASAASSSTRLRPTRRTRTWLRGSLLPLLPPIIRSHRRLMLAMTRSEADRTNTANDYWQKGLVQLLHTDGTATFHCPPTCAVYSSPARNTVARLHAARPAHAPTRATGTSRASEPSLLVSLDDGVPPCVNRRLAVAQHRRCGLCYRRTGGVSETANPLVPLTAPRCGDADDWTNRRSNAKLGMHSAAYRRRRKRKHLHSSACYLRSALHILRDGICTESAHAGQRAGADRDAPSCIRRTRTTSDPRASIADASTPTPSASRLRAVVSEFAADGLLLLGDLTGVLKRDPVWTELLPSRPPPHPSPAPGA